MASGLREPICCICTNWSRPTRRSFYDRHQSRAVAAAAATMPQGRRPWLPQRQLQILLLLVLIGGAIFFQLMLLLTHKKKGACPPERTALQLCLLRQNRTIPLVVAMPLLFESTTTALEKRLDQFFLQYKSCTLTWPDGYKRRCLWSSPPRRRRRKTTRCAPSCGRICVASTLTLRRPCRSATNTTQVGQRRPPQ